MLPTDSIKCLLLNTKFSEKSFWNYTIACELVDRKAPSAPLGLVTVAALLPQHWEFRLLDLNANEFDQLDWIWADMVCIGGMLPQQQEMLSYIRRGQKDGKIVVVGGADPTSQPDLYSEADVRVLGEGEITIPMWLEQWQNTGSPLGLFQSDEKPDVSTSPVPRFDLLNFGDYLQIGVQYSRGCPFNCEFCDIIELFGRKPRTKSPDQFMAELQRLYDLGYRGSVEFVDDNFIGNKRFVKRDLLPVLIEWQRQRHYPFYFHTEASMNLADDKKLLRQMVAADFRFVFLGIESPDPEILLQTQKSQNTMGSMVDRIHTIQKSGIVVLGGFIMGFDGEKTHTDQSMIRLVEEANVCAAMIGLLVALPNTQLTKRLLREGRLLDFKGELYLGSSLETGNTDAAVVEVVDQTSAGLNFVTKRNREEIFTEFSNVVSTLFDPKIYADRVIRMARMTNPKPKHLPDLRESLIQGRGLIRMGVLFFKRGGSFRHFLRVFFATVILGPFKTEIAMRMMALFLHFEKQRDHILASIQRQIAMSRQVTAEQQQMDLEMAMKQAAIHAKLDNLDELKSLGV